MVPEAVVRPGEPEPRTPLGRSGACWHFYSIAGLILAMGPDESSYAAGEYLVEVPDRGAFEGDLGKGSRPAVEGHIVLLLAGKRRRKGRRERN